MRVLRVSTKGKSSLLGDTGERRGESNDFLQIKCGRVLNIHTCVFIHPRIIQGLKK